VAGKEKRCQRKGRERKRDVGRGGEGKKGAETSSAQESS